jgi:PAS domain S-box-containing protein
MTTELDDALLTAFLTHAADAIEVTDADLRIEYVNPSFERITGYSLSEVIGRTPAELLRPEDADPAPYEAIVATIAAGEVWQGELEAIRKDRSRWISEVTISPICDTAGEVARYIAIKRDITERKETEAKLMASEARFKDFAETASDWLWETDAEHRFVYLADESGAYRGPGLPPAAGKTRFDFRIDDDSGDEEWAGHRADLDARRPFRDFIFDRLDATGAVRKIKVSGNPIFDRNGSFLGYRGTGSDVTELRRREDALKLSEARFKGFAETASDWFWETDARHRFTSQVENTASYSGPKLPHAEGKTRLDFRAKDDHDDRKWADHLADLDAQRPFDNFTYDRADGTGEVRKITVNGRPIFGSDGSFLGYRGTGRDITEHSRQADELRKSEKALKALNEELEQRVEDRAGELAEKTTLLEATFENLSEGFALFDAEDRLVYWNDAYAKFASQIADRIRQGAKYESLLRAFIASGSAIYSDVETEALVKERMARRRQSGSNYELQLTDGSWVLLRRHKTRDGGIAHVHTDITDLKRGEEALRESERRLSLLMDSVPALFSCIDSERRFQFTNAQYQRMFGLSAENLIGKYVNEVLGEKAYGVAAPFIDRALSGERVEFDIVVKNTEGESRHLHASYVPDIDESGATVGAFALAIDNTENRQRERTLELATAEAAQANKAKSEFLSAMSHEIRTPLNAILGFAQLLRDYSDVQLTEDQNTNIEHVINGGHHLLSLVNEILDLAKIESVGFDLSLEPTNLMQAIQQSLAVAKPLADQRNISLNISPAISAETWVRADPNRFKQVLLNLISNAIKYNRDKGAVTIDANLTGNGRARITVSDTGPGIPAESHDEVFLPFSRLGLESSQIEGTGIGLTISRQLVENMAGELDFDSTPGEGSTFWLELPLADAASS